MLVIVYITDLIFPLHSVILTIVMKFVKTITEFVEVEITIMCTITELIRARSAISVSITASFERFRLNQDFSITINRFKFLD